ncbi:MAG: acyl-CoA dehydrogenase family protein [bacterium]|nr:acyl-CoA dehydrogenase family protein [bacterium]MCY4273029.1 acyl-CoA dehydrogenase family protein [bacterium]
MRVELTHDQLALQQELRTYFANLMTDEVRERIRHSETEANEDYKALIRQIGRDGWLGVGWPKEYGGKGFTPIEQYIFFNECWAAQVPVPFLTINTVGPTIRDYGTDRQKGFFLKKILAGEMHFSIGYSEPTAGTDLAALKTRAVRDGDEWVVNGQKMFTSLAYDADYVWLAARTDPDAPAHKGITMFLAPTDDPGFDIQPFVTMGNSHTTATFYDNVRVPDWLRVGEVNGGWGLITSQLNHERVSLCASGGIANLVAQAVDWAKEAKLPDGRRVIDQEWVQVKLAECRARVEFLDLLNWKVAHESTVGAHVNPALASAIKVWGSESMHLIYAGLTEVVGATGHLKKGSPHADFSHRMEESYRGCWVLTFGGGTNEIQRDIIGMAGLGLPREKRRK